MFRSRLSMIAITFLANYWNSAINEKSQIGLTCIVLNIELLLLTVTGVSTTYAVALAVVILRVKASCIASVDGFKLWLLTWLIGQLRRHVISRLSLVRFDPSIVTVK